MREPLVQAGPTIMGHDSPVPVMLIGPPPGVATNFETPMAQRFERDLCFLVTRWDASEVYSLFAEMCQHQLKYVKNWALMGVTTKGDRRVWLTDMHQIEQSNLNRQFLFRNSDIGKMKSVSAAAAAVAMNAAI
jgi:hypothetical protein